MKKAAFVGAGIIGSGLAVNAVMHGYQVYLYDIGNPEQIRERIWSILHIFTRNGVCSEEEAEEYFHTMILSADLEEVVKDAEIVQECIAERLDLKREVYAQIQAICKDSAVIASSTSELFPSALSEGALYPERIIVGHPYNPSYLLPVIEICGGTTASEDTVKKAKAIYESWNKVPVICRKEVKGFVVNSLSWAAMRTCREQVVNGVCTAEDMDKATMYGPGLRMAVLGQILTMSLGTEGGFRKMDEKYGRPFNPDNEIMAQGVDEILSHRAPEIGNTEDGVKEYRDRMLIDILRLQNLM